jgi:PAS domain S-box-containing protein
VSDAVVGLDKDWRYSYVNQQAARLFGRRPEDLIGKHIWTEFPEGVGQPFQLAYEKAMAEQVFIQMEGCYQPWDRWFENRIYPSPDGVSIFFHEITERKRAEAAADESPRLLQAQNRVLQRIAEGSPLSETLDLLLRTIEEQCSDPLLCSILLLDQEGRTVRHAAAPSLPPAFTRAIDGEPIGPCAGSCGTAAFRREPVIVEDIETDPLWERYRDFALQHGLRACWSTPIFDSEGRVLGTFALYFEKPCRPTRSHAELIGMATHTAAIAIVKEREAAALRESEQRLRLAVTGGNVGIWEWSVGSNHLICSEQLRKILGWAEGDVTLGRFTKLVHPRDRGRLRSALRRSLMHRAAYEVEFRICEPGASVRWIAAKGRGEHSDGKPVRVFGVALDITDRKLAEREARRREAQLAEAQHIARIGSYEWDVQTNQVHRSDELLRIFGRTAKEFPATLEAYLERVHPDDRESTRTIIERAFAEGKPFAFEERIVRGDGAIRVLASQGRWVLDDARRPVKLIGICQDITERRASEEQIRRSEERFQIVARATNDAIWDWDLATDRVWWNQGITTLFGYRAEQVGRDADWARSRLHSDDLERVSSAIRMMMDRREQFWAGEYRFLRADGSYANVLDRGFVIYDGSGKPARVIGVMTDITERKRAMETLEERVAARTAELQVRNTELHREIRQRERAEQLLRGRNEELKSFAYTVSHDLKAPLRGIAGYAQELERRHRAGLSERALFCIQQVLTATRNLDHLIEDLLHYSRLDAETPGGSEVDLAAAIEGILKDRKGVIAETRAEVVVDLPVSVIRTWERGLVQAVANLIDNALKYSRNANPPRLTISSGKSGDDFLIAVSDNGIGFDMKYHDRIFGLFNRLVRQEEFEGTGLGLAIVKKVVEKLGGAAWAESQPNEGARFYLRLPDRKPEGAADPR